jgi:dTDP-4-dehydrorhamnose 3,5-epimerase-like enzyme
LVESKAGIIPRSSLLDPGVRFSPHPAPDVLSFRFCSCEDNRGSFREWLEGFWFSSFGGFHQHDEDVPSHH